MTAEKLGITACLALTDEFLRAIRVTRTKRELYELMEAVTREMGFRHFALIHHDDLTTDRSDRIDVKDYPAAIAERLIGQRRYRRDPVIRACLFAGSAFLWSDLPSIIRLDRQDHHSIEFGAREGLNEGITVPHFRLNDCPGSCTFAGAPCLLRARRYLGPAQMIGTFAFQAARRLVRAAGAPPAPPPRLHPRPRDCVVLAGRGYSNKQIARELGLTPRTVDGYLTEARRLFESHDRTELLVSAVLAGEIGLHELSRGQPG
ncbi:autoinducer binding domain-containing protein [Sphingobium sp.]|uniref:helix-turn-helix transcriptional regulator n=1 Tax=Sphingobium sp. TaxID=1912891 RepID=UPI0035C6FFDB